MKAVLIFDLPEEKEEFDDTVKARDYYSALWDIYTELHWQMKYGDREVVKLESVNDKFQRILEENKVDLDG